MEVVERVQVEAKAESSRVSRQCVSMSPRERWSWRYISSLDSATLPYLTSFGRGGRRAYHSEPIQASPLLESLVSAGIGRAGLSVQVSIMTLPQPYSRPGRR